MRARTIGSGIVLCLLGLAAPQAHATGADSNYRGGCSYSTLNDTTPGGQLGGQDQWTGDEYAVVALYSPTYGNVVNATVTCALKVNGVEITRTPAHAGSGVVAFGGTLSFTAAITDVIQLCTIVDFTSDETPTRYDCEEATTLELIPQEWVDALNSVLDLVDMIVAPVFYAGDQVVCPVLEALAPGSGPVAIRPDGDVYVDGELYYDCPPYESGPPNDSWSLTGLTGGGWDDGDTGFLTLVSSETATVGYPVPTDQHDVAATCAFHRGADGTVEVHGYAATARPGVADTTAIHCRLLDAAGATLYDRTATATGAVATFSDTVAAAAGKVSVCTEGTGTWGTTTAATGFHCRYA